ncbi:response regulator transcription factor [Amycolatopsis sp. NPDC049688]|uniref:response regulator transcription factor n=1 Tax=Amycolatopsis sp. NPDC049688 TaxID=3154733 RepID=UPI0034182E4B
MTTAPTYPRSQPPAQVPGELPELIEWAVDRLEQVQDVLIGVTKALSAETGDDRADPGVLPRRAGARAAGRSLTDREQRVLTLVSAGLSNREIARTMGISDKTAKNHVRALFLKLGVTSRTKAAFTALSEGLVDAGECGRASDGGTGPVPVQRHHSGGGAGRVPPSSAASGGEPAPFPGTDGPSR